MIEQTETIKTEINIFAKNLLIFSHLTKKKFHIFTLSLRAFYSYLHVINYNFIVYFKN